MATRVESNDSRSKGAAGETVYVTLRGEILSGQISQERLTEHDLSERFGVSRTPVREALKRLAAEGLVAVEPGRGLVVRRPSTEEIIETFVVHEYVQALAARLCAERSTEIDVLRMKTLLNECDAALKAGKYARAMELTARFEEAFRETTRNRKLAQIIGFLHTSLAPTSISDSRERIRQQLKEHRAIANAIESRRPEVAEAAAREHSRRSRDHRLRMLMLGADKTATR